MNNSNVKESIIYIYQILKKYSDENHILTTNMILDILADRYGVIMDRRAIYRNIKALNDAGISIGEYKDNGIGYYLIDRDFEVFDIRLLCDAIATSDMIPAMESRDIIKRLINTLSIYDGRMLEKTIYVKENQRNDGKRLFYNIDVLLSAIQQGVKVAAHTTYIGYDGEPVLSEEMIVFSPYATVWAAGEYYVIAQTENDEELTFYRIDRIDRIEILERNADFFYGSLNVQEYAQKIIINKGEKPFDAVIETGIDKWSDLVDVFKTVSVIKKDNERIRVKIRDYHHRIERWVKLNLECTEVIEPMTFSEEIQRMVMEAGKRYV